MFFEYEPSGVNDTYLRLTRGGVSCIMVPAGGWNGLLRVNYLVAGSAGRPEPYLIFRALDVGWDDGRFFWKGRAAPLTGSPAMVDLLIERGMIRRDEAEAVLSGTGGGDDRTARDETLMLRALIGGATFTPLYDQGRHGGGPAAVTGFAVRTLAESRAYVVPARNGLPVLDGATRDALRRQVG